MPGSGFMVSVLGVSAPDGELWSIRWVLVANVLLQCVAHKSKVCVQCISSVVQWATKCSRWEQPSTVDCLTVV